MITVALVALAVVAYKASAYSVEPSAHTGWLIGAGICVAVAAVRLLRRVG